LHKFGELLTKLENASYTGNQAWKKTNVNRIFAIFAKKCFVSGSLAGL